MFAANGILFTHESPSGDETFVTRKITRSIARIKAKLEDTLFMGNVDAGHDWAYARGYVDAMWRMLQHGEPTNLVVATGTSHTVRDFLRFAFEPVGLDRENQVKLDNRNLRPTEFSSLIVDPSKASRLHCWSPEVLTRKLAGIIDDKEIQALQLGATSL